MVAPAAVMASAAITAPVVVLEVALGVASEVALGVAWEEALVIAP